MASGVNVYVPEVVLLTVAGLHVPVMPLVEVVGNTGAAEPLQKAATGLKLGVVNAFTVTGKVVVEAHWPTSGVNVYVPEVVLLTVAGLHVPVIPLLEVFGNTGATDPLHMGVMVLKVGMMLATPVIVTE